MAQKLALKSVCCDAVNVEEKKQNFVNKLKYKDGQEGPFV